MDEDEINSLHAIAAALRQQGFVRDWQRPMPAFAGDLDKSGLRIPVLVEIHDFDFATPPVVRLLRTGDARLKPVAHVAGPEGVLCYLDTRATVLDRYDPSGTVLRCLIEAERVLRDALRGRSDQDFAGEFLSYWADLTALVDLPVTFEGEAAVLWLDLRGDGYVTPLLSRPNHVPRSFIQAHRRASGTNLALLSERCSVVEHVGNLTVDPQGPWPPADIAALKAWLDQMGPKAAGSLDQVMGAGEGTRRWIAVKAANGCAIAMVDIPGTLNTPEFLVNRKETLLPNLLRQSDRVKVERYRGHPVDERYLYSRNLGDMKSLAGRSIALIGCGTIGGFLSKQLAQSGAGSLGGRLILFDNDTLQPGNLGRHLLGVADLTRNKAEGCRDHIMRDLPHLDVSAEPIDAMHALPALSRYALVIDATGEEAFSIALNHRAAQRARQFPPVLYVWLAGNGAIAQSLLCDGPEHACYKCMKPELAGQPRYRAIRSDRETELDSNAACGDALFVPFPVSRSVAAAALGLEAALGWINDKPAPRFRNRVLDAGQAYNLKDTNPAPSSSCPACGIKAA